MKDLRRVARTLLLLVSMPILGCGKGEQPSSDTSLRSIQPNEAQRAARAEKKTRREAEHAARAVEESAAFVVLKGVFRDNGIDLTKEEWSIARNVEACYIDSWNMVVQKGNAILTDEQKSIRKGLYDENTQ